MPTTGFHRVDTPYSQMVFYLWEIMAALVTCEWAQSKVRSIHTAWMSSCVRTQKITQKHLEMLLELDKSAGDASTRLS